MKSTLSEKVCILLLRNGYTIKSIGRGCFDIVARKETNILLIKVLEDANSVSRENAEQMMRVGSYINASPIIIAEKAGQRLDDFVVYTRFGIYTLSFNTFREGIADKLPFLQRDHAGLKAELLGGRLRKLREDAGVSLNTLARKLGVSSRMVSKYEHENSEITVKKALKMYDIFGHEVFHKIDIFHSGKKTPDDISSDLTKKYHDLGFMATETKKVPFRIIAKKPNEIILTEVGDKVDANTLSLAKLIDADSLVIFNKKKPKSIPSLSKEEFMEFEGSEELVKFLKEFY